MNKKILAVLAAVSGIALQTETVAAQNQGGFTGPSVEVITVEQAKNMNDDAFVILRGSIKQNAATIFMSLPTAPAASMSKSTKTNGTALTSVPKMLSKSAAKLTKAGQPSKLTSTG